ncbi:hypothetical protein HY571_01015 [Candidatus Micrarchaeota archaeon]|nr:hypothetical protein [Candidatus Micrarchaeota archaeon]
MVDLRKEFEKLLEKHGSQGWWPGETKFEICISAVLTQNTNWRNVEKAIANLRREKILTEKGIAQCELAKLEQLVKPSGFYRQKARRIKNFSNYVVEKYGSVEKWFEKRSANELRAELLELNGVGPETADSIILYAADRPVFVIDAYTKKWTKQFAVTGNYEELQAWFEENLPRDVALFKEFHALIVAQGKLK